MIRQNPGKSLISSRLWVNLANRENQIIFDQEHIFVVDGKLVLS